MPPTNDQRHTHTPHTHTHTHTHAHTHTHTTHWVVSMPLTNDCRIQDPGAGPRIQDPPSSQLQQRLLHEAEQRQERVVEGMGQVQLLLQLLADVE